VSGPVVLVASDLDRTLIYSRGALDLPRGNDTELECVEVHDGERASFMTAEAAQDVRWLAGRTVLVPTTTRTRAQLSRVRLPGAPAPFAVAANGGVLLVDGHPDRTWTARVTATLAATSATLDEIWPHLRSVFDPSFTHKLRRAEDLFAYAVTQRDAVPDGLIADLTAWADERGWSTSRQGRKVYVVPHRLTKSAAVAEVAQRVGAELVLAAGDSLLDADLLELADRAVRPRHGELVDAGWSRPHVEVTSASGVLAGEQIAAWFVQSTRTARATLTGSGR
jgi:hypothetical protein